jgi:hypothetical protein
MICQLANNFFVLHIRVLLQAVCVSHANRSPLSSGIYLATMITHHSDRHKQKAFNTCCSLHT